MDFQADNSYLLIFERFGLEDLFMENGVDLAVWAHQHSYERMWPIYNYTILNGSDAEPYRNPKAVVHVTTGSAVRFPATYAYSHFFSTIVAK